MTVIKYIWISFIILLVSCTDNLSLKDTGSWIKLTEGQYIDGYFIYNNEVYGSYVTCPQEYKYCEPLQGVDIESFQVCEGTGYAKDKNFVYYPISIICEDAENWSLCYFEDYIVKNATPTNFIYLGDGYGISGKRLFFEGKEIQWDYDLIKKYE